MNPPRTRRTIGAGASAAFTCASLLLLAGCGSGDQAAAPAPTVMVTTVAPRQGQVTRWLTAYGSATPSLDGSQTLSVAQPGQVASLAVTPGASVSAGQELLHFAVAPSTLASYEAAATTLASASKQRDTTAQLLAQQLATRDQLTQAEKAVADAQAALTALRREGAGQGIHILRAPFDGIVTAIPVAQGDRTLAGAALVTVARKGAIIVTVGIDPALRPSLRVGQAARLAGLADQADTAAPIAGSILRIDGQLNPTTRLVDVDLRFPAGAILAGQAVRADIAAGQDSGWVVPHDAVVTGGQDSANVFQIVAGKAHAVPVQLIQTDARQDVVSGAIDARRPLIVGGAYQVADGDAVRSTR
ncbi:efflux RND transporter periplasmic adaptor subunit [Sphingomonas abietis]|uniref:Efflux RND transporter periplasmic adaptor subunit n=1 Tax=Sphingomonas abietis TaxID=3012344 RepID=A0ABY7NJ82_9SPHN|nr:efflux RND transporter periplasmic adaptor subunit [Sphingomonas abietis]WBO21302.1 efflux RND transporter periplasmic adaptor subunit [Sphingomonas abietis]